MVDYKVSLTDFFKEYMFKGKIHLPCEVSDFTIEVFKYDPEKRLFIGKGEDVKGLSAIIGEITPKDEKEAIVELKQIYGPNNRNYRSDEAECFSGTLKKTEDQVVLSGENIDMHASPDIYSFELKTTIRRTMAHVGWMDNALHLELPRKEE